MNGTALARRYADGFVGFACQTIGLDNALKELQLVKTIFRENPDFSEFLNSPQISYLEKCNFFDQVLSSSVSEDTRYFLKLLLKKGRINNFYVIAEYARIKYTHQGEINAVLSLSSLLDDDVIRKVKETLEERLKLKLRLYLNIDPALLGGIKITIGNKVIDGSVKRNLADLKEKLLSTRMT